MDAKPTAQLPEDRPVGNWRMAATFGGFALFVAITLFGAAGRLDWVMGWIYLAAVIVTAVASRILMARANPDLVAERARFADKPDVKGWDRLLMPFVGIVGPFAIWVIAGLNERFLWPPEMPLWLQIGGVAVLAFGCVFSTWAMVANRFFSAVVRIQVDRGHRVVSDGPYRYVRHPGYTGSAAAWLGAALMLASWWALVPAALVTLALVVRTALEDRTLQVELNGYGEYAGRVRYRLLPGVW
jgi:protein-S-isoprenylcysteine O-methyltransferase Ste14